MLHRMPYSSLRLPLLITGIAGVAGYNAFRFFRDRFPGEVVGTRRVDNWPLSGDGIVACDIHDRDGLRRLFDRYRFRSVVHAEGTCRLKHCEYDPEMAWQINVEGLSNLLDNLSADARLVHLSVDLVFSGSGSGSHREDDPTDPVTVYGQTMVETERILARRRPDSCILRISLPMGISFNGHAGAIDWIQSRFRKQKPATLFLDEVRSPTYTDCLNLVIERMLGTDLSGIFHAGGPRALSLYQIAQIVNRIGGYDPQHLRGCPRAEAGPVPPRAGDVSMDSSKLRDALGEQILDPWPLEELMFPTHADWHRVRDCEPIGSPELLARVLYRNPRRDRGAFP